MVFRLAVIISALAGNRLAHLSYTQDAIVKSRLLSHSLAISTLSIKIKSPLRRQRHILRDYEIAVTKSPDFGRRRLQNSALCGKM